MFSSHLLSRKERYFRWGILGVFSAPLLGAYFYNQGWRSSFLSCPIRYFAGIPCPTCGMTRSFMAVAAGDWNRAFAQHLFGPFLVVICAIAVVHIAVEIKFGYRLITFYSGKTLGRKIQILGLLAYLGYYIIRLYLLSIDGELYLGFIQSPLGEIIMGR